VIPEGTYILTSSIVGIVDRADIIDGSSIEVGDTVIGVESSGMHTNGYSLVRKLLDMKPGLAKYDVKGISFINSVLEPHRCYYTYLKDLFPQKIIKGMAHITGGGIKENLNRILPETLNAVIDLSLLQIPSMFSVIKKEGNISDDEMLRTFNLGIGLTIVCRSIDSEKIISHLQGLGLKSYIIGNIAKGSKNVITENSLQWE
jgi:phosphoribosylformylglycinamidine cyclo-ligase